MAPAQREPNVVVLGGGSWGTTVASICARRGPTLQWVRSEETADDINKNHRNSKYLGNEVVLSPGLEATTDFSEAANRADVVVMGVPSHGFRGVLTELAKELRPWVPVVSLVKGLEQGTNYRMSQIVDEVLPGHPAGILAGPNIAREVGEAVGGHRDTFAGLAGTGDLIVTCTSQRSRNRHVGEQLGAGKPIDEIIASMNQVAEGVKASSVIMEFADKYGINMPIAREVDGVINHGSNVEQAYRGLMVETPGHEIHGSGF